MEVKNLLDIVPACSGSGGGAAEAFVDSEHKEEKRSRSTDRFFSSVKRQRTAFSNLIDGFIFELLASQVCMCV